MTSQLSSQKGVSASGVRLFERALACGFQPSRTSCGPAQFLRARREAGKKRRAI
jgi:hypothetical protein